MGIPDVFQLLHFSPTFNVCKWYCPLQINVPIIKELDSNIVKEELPEKELFMEKIGLVQKESVPLKVL